MRAVELSRDHGFTPVVDLMVGFPFETAEDEEATLSLIRWVVRSGRIVAETQPARSVVHQAGADHEVTFTKGEGIVA